jgi:cell division septum initiation protein DivIVA
MTEERFLKYVIPRLAVAASHQLEDAPSAVRREIVRAVIRRAERLLEEAKAERTRILRGMELRERERRRALDLPARRRGGRS